MLARDTESVAKIDECAFLKKNKIKSVANLNIRRCDRWQTLELVRFPIPSLNLEFVANTLKCVNFQIRRYASLTNFI